MGSTMLYDYARHFMWKRRGDKGDWALPSLCLHEPQDEEKARQHLNTFNIPSINPFGELKFTPLEYSTNKKENNMCYGQTTANVTIQGTEKKDTSLQYIKDRAREIFYEKQAEIEEIFRPLRPKNFKEAQKWIKDGNFRFTAETDDGLDDEPVESNYYYGLEHHFHWGKTGPDTKKRSAALSLLQKDFTNMKDTVSIVSDEATRLQALKDFESKVYN